MVCFMFYMLVLTTVENSSSHGLIFCLENSCPFPLPSVSLLHLISFLVPFLLVSFPFKSGDGTYSWWWCGEEFRKSTQQKMQGSQTLFPKTLLTFWKYFSIVFYGKYAFMYNFIGNLLCKFVFIFLF